MRIRCPTQLALPTPYGQKIPAKILAAPGTDVHVSVNSPRLAEIELGFCLLGLELVP